MEILVGCGLVPQIERFLCNYLEQFTMVKQAGRYYVTPFKGYWGVT